jgi:lipoyltransferase 1
MATKLVQNLMNKSRLSIALMSSTKRVNVMQVSRFSSKKEDDQKKAPVKKSVFISQSYDIFTNLALEDWIYRNYNFSDHHILMLWQNDPCVVIGRHQNPFSETNVANLRSVGIEMARRNSGGGTVYHDRGNLNCSFFTPRDRYDRKYNLNLITRAIYREYGIDTEISDRDDILLRGKKVSELSTIITCDSIPHFSFSLFNLNQKVESPKSNS